MKTTNQGLDIVVPFYNEASVLAQLCGDLIAQVDGQGSALDKSLFRVIVVNNASTDNSLAVLKDYQGLQTMPELIVIDEPEKGVVQARKTGSEFTLENTTNYPYLLHIDADNRLPTTLVYSALQHFQQGDVDVLAYSGHFATNFWLNVPQLAEHLFHGVGIVEFAEETRQAFDFKPQQALFSEQIFDDFIRVPNQLGLGVRKDLFQAAGAYVREYQTNGEEILGEARNLWFRLDRLGARLKHVREPFITLNPRRLLCDPVRWCGGRSYDGGMVDLRDDNSNSSDQYALLNRLASTVDFSQVRRNLIKRLIIEPCVANPARLQQQADYFKGCLNPINNDITHWSRTHNINTYADVLPLVLQLCERYSDTVLHNLCQLRGIDSSTFKIKRVAQ